MSIRLAYLVSQYPAITHTFILREIRALRSQGFNIEAVSIRPVDRPREKLSQEEREEADRTWAVLSQSAGTILAAHASTLASRPRAYLTGLLSAMKLGGWDVRATAYNMAYFAEAVVAGHHIHRRGIAHLHTHFSSTVALLLGRVFPVTVSSTIHGPEEFDNAAGFYLAPKVAEAKFVCAISQYARSQLMRASAPEHWHKIEVAPLGVNPAQFTPRPHRSQPQRFELVSVGRLAPVKAHAVLIDAIGRLVKKGRNLRLRIAGGGPEFEPLNRQIQRLGLEASVILEGPSSQDHVRSMYQESDLFVLASFAEGVPVVLMEAMAMEVPCVATNITGIPELIRHGESGWLVPPSDPTQFADAVEFLMDHPDLRQKLGQEGRAAVLDRYHLDKNVLHLGSIFRRYLEDEARGSKEANAC